MKKLISLLRGRIEAFRLECDFLGRFIRMISSRSERVNHQGVDMVFATPNALTKFRVRSFSSKEPETLEWIDSFPNGSILWDIGANVGMYSIYAGKRGCSVVCFEPSVFNLEVLARNIHLNLLTKSLSICPLPLIDASGCSAFRMTNPCSGSALSTFRESYGADGRRLDETFSYQTFGLSLDEFLKIFKCDPPNYVKLDVDGVEHLILRGGRMVLRNVKEVLVEISPEFAEQRDECYAVMTELKFRMKASKKARHSTTNEIWTKY